MLLRPPFLAFLPSLLLEEEEEEEGEGEGMMPPLFVGVHPVVASSWAHAMRTARRRR